MDGGESRKSSATFFDQPTPSPCVMIAYQNARIKKKTLVSELGLYIMLLLLLLHLHGRTNQRQNERSSSKQAA